MELNMKNLLRWALRGLEQTIIDEGIQIRTTNDFSMSIISLQVHMKLYNDYEAQLRNLREEGGLNG